ncbi:5-formyltetrahydrofolate cyclo-ligase [Gloeobacter morelensis]|uniref:5-formyltetrahydrofolate cyclo-ligase n=1 Tax=Gloeobacter morelensis MG652769 TaxID=2781736 RepID=A0ABY3PRZ6_9CYAN|nr:5-formyltetrahydrofolate cyclo-ligase [Gloeobacter morelensis]UFP96481.1 5-formyltetrahydrofolate cyclo-ligase [Gloeobacter morelensis MG652769]
MNKADLRALCLGRRRALSPEACERMSERIRTYLSGRLESTDRCILAYLPFCNEPDLRPLFADGRTWAVPRVAGAQLTWHRYEPGRVGRGAMGPPEPEPDCEAVDPAGAAWVLVPVVACDRRGYRIGYGGGYYDRFLARYALPAIAVGYSEFVYEQVPTDPWDRPMGGIVTEAGFLWPEIAQPGA